MLKISHKVGVGTQPVAVASCEDGEHEADPERKSMHELMQRWPFLPTQQLEKKTTAPAKIKPVKLPCVQEFWVVPAVVVDLVDNATEKRLMQMNLAPWLRLSQA
mmetsp:Transcript_99650/g.177398  ORF Transcript_99650/g.177398 Transcript_99650/m.177398 type:complete len:104 (+) Transcript_99650:510-821(+)